MFEGTTFVASINSDAEYRQALATVEPMLAAQPAVGTPEHADALALVAAIEAYETARGWEMDEPSPRDLEEFRRDQGTESAAAVR